jgi:hypothetical protein
MYKAFIDEKEAEVIGKIRWRKKNGKRYLLWICLTFIGALGGFAGAALLGIPDWGCLLVYFVITNLPAFLIYRLIALEEKAGKAFAESLKEGK